MNMFQSLKGFMKAVKKEVKKGMKKEMAKARPEYINLEDGDGISIAVTTTDDLDHGWDFPRGTIMIPNDEMMIRKAKEILGIKVEKKGVNTRGIDWELLHRLNESFTSSYTDKDGRTVGLKKKKDDGLLPKPKKVEAVTVDNSIPSFQYD